MLSDPPSAGRRQRWGSHRRDLGACPHFRPACGLPQEAIYACKDSTACAHCTLGGVVIKADSWRNLFFKPGACWQNQVGVMPHRVQFK